jgi:hypothetical protein
LFIFFLVVTFINLDSHEQCCGSGIRCFFTPWIWDPNPAPFLMKFSYITGIFRILVILSF